MPEEKELFKTVMRGYDKDDVLTEIQKIKDDHYAEKKQLNDKIEELEKQLKEKDEKIEELSASLQDKDTELQDMDKNIKEKYQSYIDNYDTIGSLIFESKIRAKQIEREAEQQKQMILEDARLEAEKIKVQADEEAKKTLEEGSKKAEEKTRDAEVKLGAVQEELNSMVETVNRVQRLFMKSYKSIQKTVSSMPEDDGNDLVDEDFFGDTF